MGEPQFARLTSASWFRGLQIISSGTTIMLGLSVTRDLRHCLRTRISCSWGRKSLRENSILSQGIALRAAEKPCFVSGHDFSRAINDLEICRALAPASPARSQIFPQLV